MVRLIHSGGRQPEHLQSVHPYLVSLGMLVQEVDDHHHLLAYAEHAEHQHGVMAVRGIGYSFQLAITAPLYSITGYCIAAAQS